MNRSWLPFPFLIPFMLALPSGFVGVCFVLWSFCFGLVFFFNVNFKVKFQGEELKATEPAQELISC